MSPGDRDTPRPVPAGLAGMPIYLDYNATTPVDPRVAAEAAPFFDRWFGNPSSDHAFGDEPRQAVERARSQVAALIGAEPDEVVFCGSGSEANALAIRGALLGDAGPRQPLHLITQATEHPAVLGACRAMQRWHDATLTVLGVDGDGLVGPDDLDRALASVGPGRTLVSIMAANNETGTVQPVAELAAVAHRHGATFHCDAAQAIGKVPVNVGRAGVDLLTVVGHKAYAPKGVGALYVRRTHTLEPLIHGGGQERGRRAGTEAVASIVALGAAAELAGVALAAGEAERLRALRDELHRLLGEALPGRVALNGSPAHRLPNTLNASIAGLLGHQVLAGAPGVAASVGSACHSGSHEPSPVLRAMGLAPARALGAIRLSLGRWSSIDEVARAAPLIAASAHALDRAGHGT